MNTSSVACLDSSYNKATQFSKGFKRNSDNFVSAFVLSFLSRYAAHEFDYGSSLYGF